MKNLVLVNKYAHGLVQAVDGAEEFEHVLADVRTFGDLLARRSDLRTALQTPFINAERRQALLDEVLRRSGAAEKARRFLLLLAEHKRLELLADIVASLPEAWNENRGVQTFEVASVVPLTDAQKERLRRELEAVERRPASLVFVLDPAIVGGISVKKGNIIYDASVQGNLDRMKEQIQQG